MTKSELVAKIATKMPNLTIKEVEMIVNAIFHEMVATLAKGKRIELRGFGAFSVRRRAPRTAVNPKNNKRIEIPYRNVLHFKTGKDLHMRLNEEA